MQVEENPRFTALLRDRAVGANPNAITVLFKDGSSSPRVEVEFPVGHRRRRGEGIPLLVKKFEHNLALRYDPARQREILDLFFDHERLAAMPVNAFMDLLAI
jgi:2-methylcitrate dehydratase